MNKRRKAMLLLLGLSLTLWGCAVGLTSSASAPELDALAAAVAKASFRDQGAVKVSVLDADETNRLCSAADVAGKPLDALVAERLMAQNRQSVRWPSDGQFLGDWREGEKIAQSGRGLTFTDDPKAANGGNCYNCHQIHRAEIAYGNIGPSLDHYAQRHGVGDPSSPQAQPALKYTWSQLWNAKAFNACSAMPRFGHSGILTETQLRHLMALLLDPKSPVNQ